MQDREDAQRTARRVLRPDIAGAYPDSTITLLVSLKVCKPRTHQGT